MVGALDKFDGRQHCYVTVKVCAQNSVPVKRELSVFQHINNLPKSEHAGRPYIRTAFDQFELVANSQSTDDMPSENFQCFAHQPMATTLFAFRKIFPRQQFPEKLLKPVLKHVLLALHFLHSEAKVVHTGLSYSLFPTTRSCYRASFARYSREEYTSPAGQYLCPRSF